MGGEGGRSSFDPKRGLSSKPKRQHSLLTESVSSNNLVTGHILGAAKQQVPPADPGHKRKSGGDGGEG